MEFGQLVSNENQQARFKTMSTLKMIYIVVLHERSNIAAFSVEHFFSEVSRKKKIFIWNVGSQGQSKISD